MSKKSQDKLEKALKHTDSLPDSWFGSIGENSFIKHIEGLPEAPSGMSAYDTLSNLEKHKDKFIKHLGEKAYHDEIEAIKAWIIFKNLYIKKDS